MAVDKNSTGYTITFAVVLITLTAVILASLATGLKPYQKANIENEKRAYILRAAGAITEQQAGEMTKKEISDMFAQVTSKVIDANGKEVEGIKAFDLDVVKEFKRTKSTPEARNYAFFQYGDQTVMPMAGNGLWGPVWAYVAIGEDKNTISGVVFDHKGETPGLGAEITKEYFVNRFLSTSKKIVDAKGNYASVDVVKGGLKKPDHQVDAIAGATITSKGVGAMLVESFKPYMIHFGKIEE